MPDGAGNLKLVRIPPDQLEATAPHWLPFVESIAKRQRCYLEQRLADITTGQVSLILIWDEQEESAKALIGMSEMQRGPDKVAKIMWVTGKNRHLWIDLLPELEQACRSIGSKTIDTLARPGWLRELKRRGYRLTHVQLEKDL